MMNTPGGGDVGMRSNAKIRRWVRQGVTGFPRASRASPTVTPGDPWFRAVLFCNAYRLAIRLKI